VDISKVGGLGLGGGQAGKGGPPAPSDAEEGLSGVIGERGERGDAGGEYGPDEVVLATERFRIGVPVPLEEVGAAGGGGEEVLVEEATGSDLEMEGRTEAEAAEKLIGDAPGRRRRGHALCTDRLGQSCAISDRHLSGRVA